MKSMFTRVSAGVSVRPREALLRNGLISSLVAGVPLFGVLYWIAVTQGNWGGVFVVQFVFLLFVFIGVVRYHSTYVDVTEDAITKHVFSKVTIVNRADVANVLMADTYRDGSSETVPQFVARGFDGHTLFRLRGVYWSRESMLTVYEALGVPVFTENDPLTLEEFYELVPDAPYWYEGKRWVAIVGILVAFGLSLALVSWLMSALGLPGIFGSGV